jgi:hypothetical protein
MTATLFIPCFTDALYPRAGISMVEILERLGQQGRLPGRNRLLRPAAVQFRLSEHDFLHHRAEPPHGRHRAHPRPRRARAEEADDFPPLTFCGNFISEFETAFPFR